MKLFISYSRDDKAWVYELWRALRDEAQHETWIDRHLVPAQDWWQTILDNIQACECFVYILTPKSAESIYCRAELDYALAFNKPILPLMLKPCDYPPALSQRRVQYQVITDDMSLDKVLFKTEQGLNVVQIGWLQGKYPEPTTPIPYPAEPIPDNKPEQVSEVFMLAEEAAAEGNLSLAEKRFQQVIDADPQGWGLAAAERLAEIRFEQKRNQHYLNVLQMAKNSALIKGARAAARVYAQKYGTDYDPNGILPGLLSAPAPAQPARIEVVAPAPPDPAPAEPAPGTQMVDGKGVPMVYVPAGKFLMGENETQHEQIITRGFWLDLTPVTNATYAGFVAEGGYRTREFWTDAGWQWAQDNKKRGPQDYPKESSAPDQPRVGVTWFEAFACCAWRGGRLPTEAEWEWAARGPENRVYPWGDSFDANRVIYGQNSGGKTASVGAGIHSAGASWVGALDMAGNVWEWVQSIYQAYPYQADDERNSNNTNNSNEMRVMRGGSWVVTIEGILRSADRLRNAPSYRDGNDGFRCARSS